MSNIIKKQIPVSELELGMHVIELDRPWLETNFLLQGFIIKSQEEIEALQAQCDFVFIEGIVQPRQTSERRKNKLGLFARAAGVLGKTDASTRRLSAQTTSGRPKDNKRASYINKIPIEKEISRAQTCYNSAKSIVKGIMDGIRIGRMLDMNEARETVDEVVDSLLRNHDALTWLTKVKEKDEYTAEHSLNVCILSATFARHLGHEENEIRQIALGGLLHDVGKAKIPLEILNKPGRFTDEEFAIMKKHPTYGQKLLASLPRSDLSAVDVAFSHHERPDGHGYPRGLKAHQIPYYAKLVSLADTYDAITSSRCYDHGRASMEALDIIYQHKGKQFDEELAIEFIRCIGVYPPGSIVELTNKEIGIVIASNERAKLKPRIILVMNADKQWMPQRVIDLMDNARCENGEPYMIARELPNGTHGIDIREFVENGLVLHR